MRWPAVSWQGCEETASNWICIYELVACRSIYLVLIILSTNASVPSEILSCREGIENSKSDTKINWYAIQFIVCVCARACVRACDMEETWKGRKKCYTGDLNHSTPSIFTLSGCSRPFVMPTSKWAQPAPERCIVSVPVEGFIGEIVEPCKHVNTQRLEIRLKKSCKISVVFQT